MSFENEDTPLLGKGKKGEIVTLGFYSSVAYIISVFGIPPIVALPGAIEYCGYLGFLIVFLLIVIGAYTATLLAKSWILLCDHWPNIASSNSKYPYSALGQQVGGFGLAKVVKIIQNLAIFGEAVPFLLLASENIYKMALGILDRDVTFSFCYILIVTLIVLIPISWIGTAKDLRHITWVGAGSVLVTCLLVFGLLFMSLPLTYEPPTLFPKSWKPLAYCFGAVAFQYGVHALILTLHKDMKEKKQLPSVIVTAFIVSFSLFGAIATAAFFLYGDSIKANIMNNFPESPLLYIAQGFVSIQAVICLVQGINVLFQDLEETFSIPDSFGWRRIILRTTLMLLVLFVAETIPHFAVALELVGGLLTTPLVFIFPPWFYAVIKYQATKQIAVMEIIMAVIIITLGVVGCIAAVIESEMQLSLEEGVGPPCYIDIGKASDPEAFNDSPKF